ncbi:MAG: hypothetical protein PHF13_06600 [Acholeplasmataceae bacterium]|nr:hypothetical protein [Acholeplasmataceae bacterium]
MKIKFILFLLILLTLTLVFSAGCTSNMSVEQNPDPIVGTWTDDENYVLDMFEDGTCLVTHIQTYGSASVGNQVRTYSYNTEGSWKRLSDNSYSLYAPNTAQATRINVIITLSDDGNTLKFTSGYTYYLKKQ